MIVQQPAGPSSGVMDNVTVIPQQDCGKISPAEAENSPTEKPKKSKKKGFCRFLRSVWKVIKRPSKSGKTKMPPLNPEESNPKVLPDACLDNPRLDASDKSQTTPTPAGACAEVPLMVTDNSPAVPVRTTGPYPVKLGLMGDSILGLIDLESDEEVNPKPQKDIESANRETNADIDPASPAKLQRNDGGISGPKAGTTSGSQKAKTDVVSTKAEAEIDPAGVKPMAKVATGTDANPEVPLPRAVTNPASPNMNTGDIPKNTTKKENGIKSNVKAVTNSKIKAVAGPANRDIKASGIPKRKPEVDPARRKPEAGPGLANPELKSADTNPAVSKAGASLNINAGGIPRVPKKTEDNIILVIPKASTNLASAKVNADDIPKIPKKTKDGIILVIPKAGTNLANAVSKADACLNINTGGIPKIPKKTDDSINPAVPRADPHPANRKVKAVVGRANLVKKAGAISRRMLGVDPARQKSEAGADLASPKLKAADSNQEEPKPSVVVNPIMHLSNKYCFFLEKMIGKGSYGAVYEGCRLSDYKKVAVKRVQLNNDTQYVMMPGYRKPVPAEVSLMLKMKKAPISPYVANMYDWYEDCSHITLVLEYIHSTETLNRFIKSQEGSRLKEKVARILMRQAVLAVKHCLEHGVFHSDLHSSNFLVDRDSLKLKLIDFGCGDELRREGYSSKDYRGALHYRPPEVFNRCKYYAMPANVWSLGVLLYKMVHGTHPFKAIPKAGDLNISNQHLSRQICDLIRQCLTINPDNRPTINQVLAHPWFKML